MICVILCFVLSCVVLKNKIDLWSQELFVFTVNLATTLKYERGMGHFCHPFGFGCEKLVVSLD